MSSSTMSNNGGNGADPSPQPYVSYLFYWKNYRENVADRMDRHISNDSPAMRKLQKGDIVWAFKRMMPGGCALVARFVVDNQGINADGNAEKKWGRHFFKSNADSAIYFILEGQPDISDLIVSMGMASDRLNIAGSYNTSMRAIKAGDDPLIEHALTLDIDRGRTDKAAIDRWNSVTIVDEADLVNNLPPGRQEFLRELAVRNRRLVIELKRLYGGVCQVTGKTPLDGLADDITEVHHIDWLTRGGADDQSNMVVVSPDIHAAIHATDARFDRSNLTFDFNGTKLPLRLNHHLKSR